MSVLEDPVTVAVFVNEVPPTQAHHEASRHVFDCPEVHGDEKDEGDVDANESFVEEESSKQVDRDCCSLEEDVEQRCCGVSARDCDLRCLMTRSLLT